MKLEKNIFDKNERAKEQDEQRKKGGYGDQYFDENESRFGGEKIDLATGKLIKSDQSIKSPHGRILEGEEILKKIMKDMQEDPATAFLKQSGFDELGNPIESKK